MKVTEVIPYEIKKYKRSKHIRIRVLAGGRVVVSTPWRTPRFLVEQFVANQSSWIAGARAKMVNIVPVQRAGSRAEYNQHKKEALRVFTARLLELNTHYQLSYKRVSIRNQKTRWGSCSKTGTLSFSYRLLFVAPEVRDYVLVHELCHIAQMNHSPKFWALVAETVPNYKLLRRQLREQNKMWL